MDHFLRSFKSVRENPKLAASSNKGFPEELHQMAKELIKTNQHKYSILKIHEIIINNLQKGKTIQEIREGLFSISKYPLCLYLDQDRPEFHQIRTFSGYYTYELKEKLDSFEQILEALGYRYDAPTQLYKLDEATRTSDTFDDKIAKIGCDLILALEDIDLYIEMLKMGPIDPIVHFLSRVQQLQQNYQPAELQYPNPNIPPRLPHQPNYLGEPFGEEMQNIYTNMPERPQHPQGNTGWNNPEPGRPDASMVNDQYSGIHQGQVALTNQRYPDQSHQQTYQGQGQGYVKHDPYPQTAPEYETKGYPNREQNPQRYHEPDRRDVQGLLYGTQEQPQNLQYATELNYNTNPGNLRPQYPNYSTNPGNPRAQGQYNKSDPYAQQPNTQDRVYVTNSPHEFNQPAMYPVQNPSDNQSRTYAPRQEPTQIQYQQERYPDNTAYSNTATNPPMTDPMHNPITDHERPGAYTHPQPGQDTRFPQNPNPGQDTRFSQNLNPGQDTRFSQNPNPGQDTRFSQNPNPGQDTRFSQNPNPGQDNRFHNPNPEIAQVDILPARGPKPTLTPGNNEFSQLPVLGNKPTSTSVDEPHGVHSGRDAGSVVDVGARIVELNKNYLDKHPLSGPEPNQGAGRDAGLPQGDPGNRFPPTTPNKPQDFRMNPSRDADETHRGNQPSEMLGGRDASETHNPKTQDYKSQTSSGESMPKFYDPQYQNQGLGIHSSTPRGAASPSITPKSTHERNEQTLVKTGSETAFETKAFGRSGSSHLHGIDEKKHSHEHKISGVKEQGSNSPNYSGNKNTSELQSANTQQQYQHEYGETVNPQRNPNPQDPNIQLPAPNMQDYGHGVGNVSHPVNVRTVQGYPPPESANPRAYQGQKEDPTRQLPAPNMQDYSHGAGNVAYHVNIPPDQGYPLQEPVNPAYPGAYQGQTEDPSRPLSDQNFSKPVGNIPLANPANRGTDRGYPPQEPPYHEAYQGQREDMQNFGQAIGNMHLANPGNRPQDPYPGNYQHEQPHANPEAYQSQMEDPRRHMPPPNDFSRGFDSNQSRFRQEQPPVAPYNATGEHQHAPQDKRFQNEQSREKDNIPYRPTGQDPPVDPFRNYPKGRPYVPKDDFSQPVSDKNTGVNDPNPARNQPPVAYPQHRNDPRFHHPQDYEVGYHGHDVHFDEDDLAMREMRDMREMGDMRGMGGMREVERQRELALRDTEQRNIAEMQRTRDLARHDDPPYHRPYDPPYQPPAPPPAPTTEWACPHCTLVNPPGIRVCNACSRTPGSNPQTADVTPTGFTKCTHCMAQTPSTARICQNCGRGLF